MELAKEIARRRTFAIISHPDAGKTTLTEKLLLFGGAIHTAGAVKSNKIRKSATSDFMEIEKQRGISVATSVMGFEYKGKRINILDTPGHKDFAEDTYRTLTAVDSVILVVDSMKGVEEQTERLMEVCRMRHTPVIIFINKLDREGRNPFELLDELEEKLDIQTCPMTWPISQGQTFKGVYNLFDKSLNLFEANTSQIGQKLTDIEIDTVFIGSCTNGRIEDLRAVAEVVKGKKIKSGLRAMVVPGSGLVRAQAEEEGIADILKDAGFEWRLAGCSMCLAMNPDQLAPGERCAATSNRNFEGRQGYKGRTHLVSPAMAAAAALTGKLTDVRELI